MTGRVFSLIVNVVTTCDMTLVTVSGHLTHTALCINLGGHANIQDQCGLIRGQIAVGDVAGGGRLGIHSALVTWTQQGWYLNWCESLIPGERGRYFCSQAGLTKRSPIEIDESFNHFCEYQGEPGGKEQGVHNRQLGHDPDEAEALYSITLTLILLILTLL